MRVSVVMTAFNQAAYLGEAIDSLLNKQDLKDFELVVVDDGSTDNSKDVVQAIKDPRLRLVERLNGGLGAARNTGVEAARGEYVAFCDADDIHLPWRLSAHAKLLDQAPAAAVVFSELTPYINGVAKTDETTLRRWLGPNTEPFDEEVDRQFGGHRSARERQVPVPAQYLDCPVYQGRVPELIALRHIAWGGASMFRRAALRAVGGHDPYLRRYADWFLVSKLSLRFELVFLDVPVLWYRQHEAQLTKNALLGAQCYLEVVHRVWKADSVFYAQHRAVVDRAEANGHYQLAVLAERAGDWTRAEEAYRRSLSIDRGQKGAYLSWARMKVKSVFSARRA